MERKERREGRSRKERIIRNNESRCREGGDGDRPRQEADPAEELGLGDNNIPQGASWPEAERKQLGVDVANRPHAPPGPLPAPTPKPGPHLPL